MLPFRECGDRLIHDSAAHPHMIVLRAKGDARELAWRQRRPRERRERLRRRNRQRGRRCHPGANRNIRRHGDTHAVHLGKRVECPELAQHAATYVAHPFGSSSCHRTLMTLSYRVEIASRTPGALTGPGPTATVVRSAIAIGSTGPPL